jgi:hypothetical protein
MAEENIDPGQQKIIDLLSKIASDKSGAKREEAETRRDQNFKKNTAAIRDNGLALVGLTAGMFSLKSMIGNQLKMNQDLATALGQTGETAKGMSAATDRFLRGQQGAEQMVKVFRDAVDMGMTRFSDDTLQFGAQLKVLGIQNKTSFQLMRANTQALGVAEEASLGLAQDLITTAIENKDSIAGLIDAINSMKDAMIDTTVELGPKAAMNAQKIAAMMSQGNSELQEASAKFVKSFLAGSDGYMKAAKLGVQFTGKESTAEMARKFETILGKIQGLQAGKQGAGSQFFFDAMERSFGLSREDFNLQTQIGTSIDALKEGNVQQLANESATINLQQTIWNKTEPFQNMLLDLTGDVTKELNKIFDKISAFSPTLGKYLMPALGALFGIVGFLGGGTLLKVFWTPIKWLGRFLLTPLTSLLKGVWMGIKALRLEMITNPAGKMAGMKTFGKNLFSWKNALKFGKGLITKVALPLTVGKAIYDGVKGFTADPSAGFGESLKNAGSSIASGLTFGLVGKSADEIAKGAEGTTPMVEEAEQRAESMNFGMSDAGMVGGGSVTNALRENTAVLREILESTKENNNLTEDQLKIISDDAGYTPIRAGRMA